MSKQILAAIHEALTGSRQIIVTFKFQATEEVNYLLDMVDRHLVALDIGDRKVLELVAEARVWPGDHSRIFTVTLTKLFDEQWFVDRLGKALEKVEAVK